MSVKFKHTEDMGEISGFGGGYEATCQQMLHNGVSFLSSRGNVEVSVLENPQIFGIVKLEGEDAKALEVAVMHDVKDCTDAMRHAVMSRLAWINKNGWKAYCEALRKPEDGEVA